MKTLIISVDYKTKGLRRGKFIVNLKEAGKGASGGFVLYNRVYDNIEFENKAWLAQGDKA